MNLFARLRHRILPINETNYAERDRLESQATEQTQRAIELMSHWDKERAEDLRRINRTGNFVEGGLVPEARKGPNRERA